MSIKCHDENVDTMKTCKPPAFRLSLQKISPVKQSLSSGFTIIELMVVVVVIGILATLAFLAYRNYVEKAKVVSAVNEINMLEKEIYTYSVDGANTFPPDLAAVGYDGFEDPWQNPYVYNPDLTVNPRTKGGTNINTDYDLYSAGQDGLSMADITAQLSLDDIIRAGNGDYKGYAKGY